MGLRQVTVCDIVILSGNGAAAASSWRRTGILPARVRDRRMGIERLNVIFLAEWERGRGDVREGRIPS